MNEYFIRRNEDYSFLVEINGAHGLVWDEDFRHAIHFDDEEKAKKFQKTINECFCENEYHYIDTDVVYIEFTSVK